jgi:glucokinase
MAWGRAMPDPSLLGFDIGGTKCAVVASPAVTGDARPDIRGRRVFPTASCAGPDAVLDRLAHEAEALLRETGLGAPVAAGVACGGPLDAGAGVVLGPPNLPGWDQVEVTAVLGRRFACPVRLENDADAGAVAEWRWGAGVGTRDFAFLTMGTGMGAGLILGGRLHRGRSGCGGEIGHVRLAPDGPEGYGKRGSCEGFCSGGGIARWAQEEGLPFATAAEVFAAAHAGDAQASAFVAKVGDRLGGLLAILADILNPERIAIGGIFPRQRDLLWPAAQAALAREGLPRAVAVLTVVPAQLGEAIGDHAALAAATTAGI